MSVTKSLFDDTVRHIVESLGLSEIHGSDGGPLMTLTSTMGPAPVGDLRAYDSGPVQRMITVSLSVERMQLDSHMLFAFTHADSPVPHFTVDSVMAGGVLAFHLDLIPRADLGSHLAYMDGAYSGLTETFMVARGIEGLTPAHLGPRQLALMSPWMLANRSTADAFAHVPALVRSYCDHWLGLMADGLPAEAIEDLDPIALPDRDVRNRAALFNPDVDPVWSNVARLVGQKDAERMRALLRGDA